MEKPEIKACPRIYTRCPSCHNTTLTIGTNGDLLCTWIDCKDPTLIDRIGQYGPCVAGDRQPVTLETVGVKALASATGSAAAEIVKALKNPRVLRWTTWDVFAGRQINHERGLSQEEAVMEVLKRYWPKTPNQIDTPYQPPNM